jgi:hypothetical protein
MRHVAKRTGTVSMIGHTSKARCHVRGVRFLVVQAGPVWELRRVAYTNDEVDDDELVSVHLREVDADEEARAAYFRLDRNA